MKKFDEIYKKIISESALVNENVDQDTIKEVVKILTTCKDKFSIPAKVKKYLSEAITLLNSNKESDNDDFEETYTWNDKIIKICKDAGENTYYFILNDEDSLEGEDWISYDNASEFDNDEGMWDSYEECLKEAKNAGNEFWEGFNFKKFKKV